MLYNLNIILPRLVYLREIFDIKKFFGKKSLKKIRGNYKNEPE